MYRYFISFIHNTHEGSGHGNVIVETNHKISDFDNTGDMEEWVNDLQKWIEDNANIKDVIIMNFKLINFCLMIYWT